jgi:hypothetical protein
MSTFYRLPVELLTIIAECAIEENHSDRDCMALPLRLTHPLFSGMDCLKAHIFSKVNFHATREGLEWVQTRLPRGIKSFVKQITFLPSPYSISTSLFHFRQIIIQQLAEGRITRTRFQQPHEYGAFLEDQWEKEPLFSPSELSAGFQKYHTEAAAAQTLLMDGSLHVWTDAIAEMPNVENFVYGDEPRLYRRKHKLSYSEFARERPTSDDYDYAGLEFQHDLDRSHDMRPLLSECSISPLHAHDPDYHREEICLLHQAKSQARLVEPVSACIIAAGARLEKLVLSSAILASNEEPDYPLTPNLRLLDLTSLRSFELQNHLIEDRCDLPATARHRNAFLIALLEKCSGSLQELKLVLGDLDDLRQAWPVKEILAVQLPALRRLRLEGFVHPIGLSRWIVTLHCLDDVDLSDAVNDRECSQALSHVCPAHTRTWRLVSMDEPIGNICGL